MGTENRPTITPTPNGPYLVKNLETLADKNGSIETKKIVALCRCGQSANKPFCDGTHAKIGFSSAKEEGRLADKQESYVGKQITIHDNRGICAHAGYCTDGLASVFRLRQEPWIDPDAATVEEVIETIRKCPSGALSYSIEDVEYRDRGDGESAIFVAPNGPYVVSGGADFGEMPLAEGVSGEHCTLCRCGSSKNKPYCDGTHWNIDFDENK